MSRLSDAADAEEDKRKGNTPKECSFCNGILGHRSKRSVTVIKHLVGRYQK